jgi:hypothetical protein
MGVDPEAFKALQQRMREKRPSSILGEVVKVKAKAKEPTPTKMNKVEQRYHLFLEQEKAAGRIAFFRWDGIKVRIGPDCFWNVDFLVVDAQGHVELHDTKAFWKSKGRPHIEDDARVKMVATATLALPVFTVVAVWERDGQWQKMTF